LQAFLKTASLDDFDIPPPPKKSKQLEDISEDEQIARAIAASLGHDVGPSSSAPAPIEISEEEDEDYSSIIAPRSRQPPVDSRHAEDRRIRQEQDRDLAESLAKDQDKELEEALRISKEEATKAHQKRKVESLPIEPPVDATDVTKTIIRLPDGTRLNRRFLANEPLQVLFDFIEVSAGEGAHMDTLEVATTHPRRVYTDPRQTFREAGLVPQAMLFVKEK